MTSSVDRGTSKVAAGDANVLMCQKRNAVVHCLSSSAVQSNVFANVSGCASNVLYKAANNHILQSFNKQGGAGNALAITSVTYSCNNTISIKRIHSKQDMANVLILQAGQGHFDYAGYAIETGNANIVVLFGHAQGFVTLGLSKGSSFEDPDLQQLQARDRIPF